MVMILNHCFTASIIYQDFIHGFQAGRDTGTATLEVKLIQQVRAMREEFFHAIFLELNKGYNTLDRSMCLEILEGYGVGTRALRHLRGYWERIHMVERAGGYYGEPFRRDIGMMKGELISPTIFNVVEDAMVCH